jgi:hypothetical protein
MIEGAPGNSPGKVATGDLRPSRRRRGGDPPPDSPTPGAPEAAHSDHPGRRPAPERLMRESPCPAVRTRTRTRAQPVRLHDTTFDHSPIRFSTLPNSLQDEHVEAAERGQARVIESRVGRCDGRGFRLHEVRFSSRLKAYLERLADED